MSAGTSLRVVVLGSTLLLASTGSLAGQESEGPPSSESAPQPPADAAGTPVVQPPAAPPPEDPSRIHFELPVGEGADRGKVVGVADRLESEGEEDAVLEGAVEIRYRDVKLRAARIVLHRSTNTLEAEGDVVFDQGPQRITAGRIDFDLETRTGTFWNASAYVPPDQYFDGAVVAKVGDTEYEIRDGVFTSCRGDETPDWSFAMTSGDLEVGEYAHIRNARLRVKKLPVFYWPYLIWPARTERTSGFLIPNLGYSGRRGAYLGLAYYQLLGPSADATLYLDGYSEGFAGFGGELRYRPSEGTRGKATLYALRNPELEDSPEFEARAAGTEWKGRFEHESNDLPLGFRGVLSWEDYSDYDYFRRFERAEQNNTRRFLYSNAFLSGTWGAHSLTVIADQRETFLGAGETVMQRQLPEIAYRLSKRKLGTSPLYLSLDTTASFLEATREGSYDVGYGRFDLAPELTLPVRVAPWLSVAVSAGGRATWWGDSVAANRLDPVTGDSERRCGDRVVGTDDIYCGDSLDRVVPSAALDLIGPSVSRIYEGSVGRFGKFKHLIEPRWSYSYTQGFDDQDRVARFDEIDRFEAAHVAQFSIINRLIAKPADPETGGDAFEILSLEIAQAYSLDDDQPLQRSRDGSVTAPESGISARLRFNPNEDVTFQAKAVWSTLFDGLDSTSLSAGLDLGRVDLDLTWFTNYDPELGETTSNQTRVGARVALVPEKLVVAANVAYNLETSKVQQQRYLLSWTSQCWGVSLEAREQVTASYQSRDYRFLLNLKNVGTFLDLTGGDATDR